MCKLLVKGVGVLFVIGMTASWMMMNVQAQVLWRSDSEYCRRVEIPPMICARDGGPGSIESQVDGRAVSRIGFARSHILEGVVATRVQAGFMNDNIAQAGFWDTLVISDPKLPQGAPLDLITTISLSGRIEAFRAVASTISATAGLRDAEDIPQDPAPSSYPFDPELDAQVAWRSHSNGTFDISADSPPVTIANGEPVSFYIHVTAHAEAASRARADVNGEATASIYAKGGNELIICSAASEQSGATSECKAIGSSTYSYRSATVGSTRVALRAGM